MRRGDASEGEGSREAPIQLFTSILLILMSVWVQPSGPRVQKVTDRSQSGIPLPGPLQNCQSSLLPEPAPFQIFPSFPLLCTRGGWTRLFYDASFAILLQTRFPSLKSQDLR